ncbi:MAG: hypothetical protein Q7R73_01480, partial [bacterium]|nr:hypothetical protein [bacterium]
LFFLIRIISLAMLLVFGPLAFLFMILPATQSHWNDWWNKLTQWSFFAPAFMFMLMLSLRTSSELLSVSLTKTKTQFELYNTIGLGVQFFMVTGLLIGSLMVAQKMGIYGASTVTGWGRGLTNYAKRQTVGRGARYGRQWVGARTKDMLGSEGVQNVLNRIPFGGGIARGLGRVTAVGEKAEKERNKEKFGFYQRLSDEAKAKYLMNERPQNARTLLEKMDAGDRQDVINKLPAEMQGALADKLRSVRAEHIVHEASNNPEVQYNIKNPNAKKELSSETYKQQVANYAKENYSGDKIGNIAPEFLKSQFAEAYIKNASEADIVNIGKQSRQHAEALGTAFADIQQKIEEESSRIIEASRRETPHNWDPNTDQGKMRVSAIEQQTADKYLTRDMQKLLNTSPGLRLMSQQKLLSEKRGGGGQIGKKDIAKIITEALKEHEQNK